MSAHHQAGAPGSCSDPRPPNPGPLPPEEMVAAISSPGSVTGGGPKELVKRASLRDVHISVALMDEFLRFASANTSRGIETCGILAGNHLDRGRFVYTAFSPKIMLHNALLTKLLPSPFAPTATLSGNDSTFTVSTLIIPKQRGTSDTVEMLSEEVRKGMSINLVHRRSPSRLRLCLPALP